MEQIQLRAMAKINLGLDVVRRREDGYHEVKMIMQTIRLFDRLVMTRTKKEGIELESNLRFLPLNETNLAYKAADLMIQKSGLKEGVHIYIQKRIPVSAGMAGGSADGAAVLFGMNRMFRLGYSDQELKEIGLKLGADVPYCLMRGTALAEGIGEVLTPLTPCPDCYVVIAKPALSVSTKFVYENLHVETITDHPDIDGLIRGIERGNLREMIPYMGNVLERVSIPAYPIIGEIKEKMMEYGAMVSLMSGSGPTVFGLFETQEGAMAAKEKLQRWGQAPMVYATELYHNRTV
ncbi:MAG: 4-(cytidine 5'-diphospho)-2-C-methyl-D-erythritol kinase [Lachnospiraceae bacterium]|nr:4-(cytidine 5'-diphospho)-2-C-methyl-D-erythritol kinase [Lachnospiraceae bacterium]